MWDEHGHFMRISKSNTTKLKRMSKFKCQLLISVFLKLVVFDILYSLVVFVVYDIWILFNPEHDIPYYLTTMIID